MKPQIFGLSAYFLSWVVATVCGIGVGYRLTRRAGFPARQSLLALVLVAVAILLGSKMLFLVEHTFFPYDDPSPAGAEGFFDAARHGFRIPGGILLMAAAVPFICRALALDTRRFVDAFIPCIGVAVVFIRVGCFLHGCCFGARTDGPFGMIFPAGSRVYEYQLLQHEVAWPATQALPVVPLQLFFATLGLLMFGFGVYWQRTKRFDGEVWANVYLLFFAGTFVLEFLRPAPLHLNLILTATTVVVTAVVGARTRQTISAAQVPS
jgi:phosphatidylglycerol---prolipoprotein diacylglyceryl transferase